MRNKLIILIINCCLFQSFICDISIDNPTSDGILPSPETPNFEDHVDAENKRDVSEPLAVTAAAIESGNTELLSPSLRGLAAMATANLPGNLHLVKVIEATREVVAGFRYDLTIEVTGNDGQAYPCRLAILERPWVTTEWGARERSLLSTNCSTGADSNSENNDLLASAPRPAEQEAERPTETPKVEPNYDSIADSGQVEELLEQFTDKDRITSTDTAKNPDQVQDHMVAQHVVKNMEHQQPQKHFVTKVEAMVGLKKWLDDVRIIQRTEKAFVFDATMNPVFVQPAPVNYHKLAEVQEDDLVQHELKQEVQQEVQQEQETQVPENQDPTLNVIGLDDDQTVLGNGAIPNQETRRRRGATTPVDSNDGVEHLLVGGASQIESSDSYIQEMMSDAFAQLVTAEGAGNKVQRHELSDCTTQVVTGSLVKCKMQVHGLGADEKHECEVKVWDRPWLGKENRETEFLCTKIHENGIRGSEKKYEFKPKVRVERSAAELLVNKKVRFTRQGFGAPSAADSNGEYLQELMQDAFAKLVTAEGGSKDAKLHELKDCSTQVVAGSLMKCTMHVHGLGAGEKHECQVEVWDRSWLGKENRETELTCFKIHENGVRGTEKKYEFKPKVRVERSAAESNKNVRFTRQGFGAPSAADPNGDYIQELMQDAFAKVVSAEGAGSAAKLHELTDCTSQVVAGSSVKCKMYIHGLGADEKHECQVEVWDRSWIPNGRRTKVFCSKIHENGVRGSEKKYSFGETQDRKKRGGVPGGVSPADSTDSYIQQLMQDAFAKLVTAEGGAKDAKLHELKDCTTQVVAGSLVTCTMHIHGLGADEKHECHVKVWDRPWIPNGRQTDITCSKIHENGIRGSEKKYAFGKTQERKKRGIAGGVSTADPNDAVIQELMQDAFAQLVTSEGSGGNAKLHELTDCTKQVVAGRLIKCTMHVHGLGADEKHECKVKIWDRPWLGKENRETEFQCTQIHENGVRGTEKKYEFKPKVRVSRSVEEVEHGAHSTGQKLRKKGATTPVDSSDSYVQELMQEAFAQLVTAEGAEDRAKLHELKDCTKQTVAGSLVKCKLHVHGLGADERHECSVKVWDRPWIPDSRETDVTCSKVLVDGETGEPKKYEFRAKKRTERSLEEHGLTHEDLKTWRLFAKFTQKHDKRYDADEARYRFGVFKGNLKRIERLNRGELGTAHYGITQFSDLTPEEFRTRHTGLLARPTHADNEVPHASATIPDGPLPESFDWRDHGAVAKVKDQGSCGSCWAFSVTGNIEGLNAIRSGKLQEFSEQELVDCDTIDSGCGGGLPDNAYKAIEQLGGLESESDYPYEGKKERCHFDKSATKVQVSGAVDLPQNETAIALWLMQNGPISIGINANAMQFYRGGVSHPWKILCKKDSLDHGVLIVGYGVHTYPKFNKTMPYWIIKNSWGPRWGEQGYYRVYRGDSTCGVDQMATSAVLENPN